MSAQKPKDMKKKKWKQVRKENQPVVFQSSHRYARISASKVRGVMNLIRGKHVHEAEQILQYSPKRGAFFLGKLLKSALANAGEMIVTKKLDSDIENFFVKEGRVDEGPIIKRWLPRARGHATPIQKQTCHISLILDEIPQEEDQRQEKKSPSKVENTSQKDLEKTKETPKEDLETRDEAQSKEATASPKEDPKEEVKSEEATDSPKEDPKEDTKEEGKSEESTDGKDKAKSSEVKPAKTEKAKGSQKQKDQKQKSKGQKTSKKKKKKKD